MIGIKLTNEEAIEIIEKKCKEFDITFLGFDNPENQYTNNKVHLKLKCNKCGYEWSTMTYDKFVQRVINCHNCGKRKKYTDEKRLNKILEKCKELDYIFNGYVENKITNFSHLKLKCNKCGYEWNTTTFNNFVKTDRKSHVCNKKNPLTMPSLLKSKEEIKNKIINKISGTSLEFVDFVEKDIKKTFNYHILLKCKKCGKISSYGIETIYLQKENLKCKTCEFNNKLSNEEATKRIIEKCKNLNYTFLGFNNKENKYNGKETKLILKCNKCGYIWKTTSFVNFCYSVIKCRGCTLSWKMEKEIIYFLNKNSISFVEQQKFKWLKNKIALSLDFYLPDYNIAIECQGRQHFEPVEKYGGEQGFKEQNERDIKKNYLCKNHNINILYYYKGKKYDYFLNEKLIKNEKELIKEIKKYGKENQSISSTK